MRECADGAEFDERGSDEGYCDDGVMPRSSSRGRKGGKWL